MSRDTVDEIFMYNKISRAVTGDCQGNVCQRLCYNGSKVDTAYEPLV